jgi:hypothetical protein
MASRGCKGAPGAGLLARWALAVFIPMIGATPGWSQGS